MKQPKKPGGRGRPPHVGLVNNLGEPIRLNEVNMHGVSASAARESGKIQVWTRLSLTSDDKIFHRIANNLMSVLEHHVREVGSPAVIRKADTILLIIRADDSAELWVDAAAMAINVMVKRDMPAGSVVFESDIADVTGMDFPMVEIGQDDRVLCLFRENWRFALYFDFNPDGNLDREMIKRHLGNLYRNLKYRQLYDAVSDNVTFDRLVENGWFPFVEILGKEFDDLVAWCEAGWELDGFEQKLLPRFDSDRLAHMYSRWLAKPHFAAKGPLLQAALEAFKGGQAVAAIKIALTEIEGVLLSAYRSRHGRGAKLPRLLKFAIESAEEKSGAPDTLLFPRAFASYLSSYTFASVNPAGPPGSAGSRHAVGHGVADAASYTQARALQALLTLDQLAFYT